MNNPYKLLEDALIAVEKKLRDEIGVDLIADEFDISSRHLQRLFKLAFNQSFGLYIRSRKLAASVDDLLNTDLNVLDIALDYGFEYEQSYIRSFKREYGITPGDLRRTGKTLKITPALSLFDSEKYLNAIVFRQQILIFLSCSSNEVVDIVNNYFKSAYKNISVQTFMIPTREFYDKLDAVLASGQRLPDVVALESVFVRKYVESGQLMDLTDIYETNKSKLLEYPVEIGTYNGRVYALSWQACPGGLFYRRSLAMKYLGTDDPRIVQEYFSTIDKFLETATLLKEKSGGSCVVVSGLNELYFPFMSARSSPWVVNGKLVIDRIIDVYLNLCKFLNDNSLHAGIDVWHENWFAGMRGEAQNEEGKPVEIFSYFLPTWAIYSVLKPNAAETKGDWALIPGPISYIWGGTWLGVYKGTNNPDAAKGLIRYFTTNDTFLEEYARESGDFVSNTAVVNRIKNNYKEPFLGNQNHYDEFSEIVQDVNGKLIQGTDCLIQEIFFKEVMPYIYGEKDKRQALDDFKAKVNAQLGLQVKSI